MPAQVPPSGRRLARFALFGLDPAAPLLTAAWASGDTLTAAAAAALWRAHDWEPLNPPADVAALIEAGEPLRAAPDP